jgi:hypothetical protein
MSIYDEYRIVINEAQRRLIMHALMNAMASDRHSSKGGALTRPTYHEYMQLIGLFSTIEPSMRKVVQCDASTGLVALPDLCFTVALQSWA